MALINLKTTLTSLKFGNDTPGGGNSGLPYVQFGIPGISATNEQDQFYKANRNSIDSIVRGGAQGSNMARAFDSDRILAFYKDNKRGPFFIQKQMELQMKNPKMETMSVITNTPGMMNVPTLLENTRVYNQGVNTLAQVSVQGTGEHIIRHGLFSFGPRQPYYMDAVNIQNITNESSTNRLLLLTKLKMKTDQGFIQNTRQTITGLINNFRDLSNPESSIRQSGLNNLLASSADFVLAKKLGISLNRNLLFNYPQGPGSVFGGGDTIVPRTTDTTRVITGTGMVYDQLRARANQQYKTVEDYRLDLNFPIDSSTSIAWDYSKDSIENRLKTGNPGLTNSDLPGGKPVDYSIPVSRDELNMLYPKIIKEGQDPYIDNKDIIKFGFECISNDDPTTSTALLFRAFLTAGITDSNSAQLNSFKYLGRGENFYTYQGFDRSIAFSFRIAALSRQELKPLYNKLNYLISQVYPDYSPITSVMRAPLVRLTIGDYIYRMPGFLENVNVTVDNNYPWEINLEGSTDVQELPQVLDVSVSFKPIFDKLPRREIDPQNQIGLIGNGQSSFMAEDKVTSLPNKPLSTSPIQRPIVEPINIPGQ